jgi:hypothetical protein
MEVEAVCFGSETLHASYFVAAVTAIHSRAAPSSIDILRCALRTFHELLDCIIYMADTAENTFRCDRLGRGGRAAGKTGTIR